MNTSTQLARHITRQLIENGIKDVVLSPGSRNAPLSIALYAAEQSNLINVHVRIDERTAGFFALGIAKASGGPVALVCTSGTAVANYHPAVLEAHHSQVSMLVITADRPERLRQTGANQTTLQAKIFGEATPLALDVFDSNFDAGEMFDALRVGPVHLNVQFDEPLLPDDEKEWLLQTGKGERAATAPVKIRELEIAESRGVIVVGHDRGGLSVDDVTKFVTSVGWPLVAEDPLSFPSAVAHASLFLTSLKVRRTLQPEVVIVIGRTTLSRSVNALIKSANREIAIDPRVATVDINRNADQIFLAIPKVRKISRTDVTWRALWDSFSNNTSKLVKNLPHWSEASIARTVARLLPDQTTFFVSSSRPIRDLEGFADPRGGIESFANRGLAGIDGNVSTALGIASQRSATLAILGDLSFLHDLTGLIGSTGINVRILIINNDGGGIFSTLPQRDSPGFEKLFGTPHGLNLALVAASMGIRTQTITSLEELEEVISKPIIGISVVVALVPSREENAHMILELFRGLELL